MQKKIIIIALIIIAIVGFGYNYIYQEHRNIDNEVAEFTLTSIDIAKEFESNSIDTEKKYLNKTIEVSGEITEINKNDITLGDKVFCQFTERINQKLKQQIKIKGRVIGYDDLLEQIKLDQCIIIN